jgi:hypothetical protein
VADVSAQYSSQANSAGWLPITSSGFYYTGSNIGRWTCNEMEVTKNTPGQSDGAIRYWVDGNLVIEKTNVDLVGSTGYNFNNAMLDTYWNGGSPKAQNRYYDNWVISKSRIGCSLLQLQRCTEADTDSSGSISSTELNAYIAKWKSGQVNLASLMEVIKKWKSGC